MLMSGFPEVQNDGRRTALCSEIGQIPKRCGGEKGETKRMRNSIYCSYHECESALCSAWHIDVFNKKPKNLQQDLGERRGGSPQDNTQRCIYSSNATCSV